MENEFLRLTDKDTGKNIYIRKKRHCYCRPINRRYSAQK